MKKRVGGLCCILIILSLSIISWKPANVTAFNADKPSAALELLQKYIDNVYESAHLQESGLAFNVFKKALTGFINLKQTATLPQSSSVLTVVDFSLPSREKRMWIIDIANKSLMLNTWVAHGERSGFDIPDHFSDRMDSRESSLGFYLTDNIYFGDHGRSLKLDGLDEGFNANARKRAIVLHAAPYVCQAAIDQHGRLGRSFGCPAVSPDVIDEVIDAIKDKNVIFVNGNSERYHSKYLDESLAASYIANLSNGNMSASL
jgi:hypothetical protein